MIMIAAALVLIGIGATLLWSGFSISRRFDRDNTHRLTVGIIVRLVLCVVFGVVFFAGGVFAGLLWTLGVG